MGGFRASRLGLVLLAAGTGTAAHVAGYFAVFHDAHGRAEALHRSGHDYLAFLAVPLVLAAAGGLALSLRRGLHRTARPVAQAEAFRFLLGVQVAGYLGSEILERGLTGELLAPETLVVWAAGAALQVVFAAAGALLYVAAERVGVAVASARRVRGRDSHVRSRPRSSRPRRIAPLIRLAPRAPPA
ncbi:MAG TPA: hypothetical protein VM841_08320 [Actinomycetota bacterium]|nr:hypothetical protein [Actinomycetota bacterium]